MRKIFIAENIMREYNRKQRYKTKIYRRELTNFIKNNCLKCQNKETQLCHIVKNIDNKFSCPFIKL